MSYSMQTHGRLVASISWLLLLSAHIVTAAAASDVPRSSPEAVGFSGKRLEQLDVVMRRGVDEGEYAGVVTLLARHGKVVHEFAYGKRDLSKNDEILKNDLFRVFSMTKPVTGAAMMILYEEGRWSFQDPISKFIPEFASLKVFNGMDSAGNVRLEEPDHPPTMRELMTHTAGFSYGNDQNPVDKLYRDELGRSIFLADSLHAMVDRLGKAPLLYQPSTQWVYSLSVDIQGYIIERLSGEPLPTFLKKRLFDPLRMSDTGFYVPKEKKDRFSAIYQMSDDGHLIPADTSPWGYTFDAEPNLPQGGAGLVSTTHDFFRFAQMLLNGGQLDGVQILAPQTVKLITSNHLADSLMAKFRGGGPMFTRPRPGVGYGLDGAVITNPGQADVPLGTGSYLWDGAGGTWFWIDPENDIVFVGMVQRWGWTSRGRIPGAPTNLEEMSRALTYQALVNAKR